MALDDDAHFREKSLHSLLSANNYNNYDDVMMMR